MPETDPETSFDSSFLVNPGYLYSSKTNSVTFTNSNYYTSQYDPDRAINFCHGNVGNSAIRTWEGNTNGVYLTSGGRHIVYTLEGFAYFNEQKTIYFTMPAAFIESGWSDSNRCTFNLIILKGMYSWEDIENECISNGDTYMEDCDESFMEDSSRSWYDSSNFFGSFTGKVCSNSSSPSNTVYYSDDTLSYDFDSNQVYSILFYHYTSGVSRFQLCANETGARPAVQSTGQFPSGFYANYVEPEPETV